MSRELVIRRVELLGDDRMWGWSFERGVNVIVGPVGTGKTTLLNLIRFGLGGSWAPTKKARESASAVRLQVRADETWLQVRRDFGANEVIVTVGQGHERRLRLGNAPSGQTTFSDLLLNLLGLPNVRVPTSRAKASKRRTSITFNDVMSYLYLEQTEIDRQTARSDDRVASHEPGDLMLRA
jgi:AAA domain